MRAEQCRPLAPGHFVKRPEEGPVCGIQVHLRPHFNRLAFLKGIRVLQLHSSEMYRAGTLHPAALARRQKESADYGVHTYMANFSYGAKAAISWRHMLHEPKTTFTYLQQVQQQSKGKYMKFDYSVVQCMQNLTASKLLLNYVPTASPPLVQPSGGHTS